jgi:hypothetical protein
MLKSSIIEQRAKEASNPRQYLQSRECKEQLNIANQAFDSIKSIIPENLYDILSKGGRHLALKRYYNYWAPSGFCNHKGDACCQGHSGNKQLAKQKTEEF